MWTLRWRVHGRVTGCRRIRGSNTDWRFCIQRDNALVRTEADDETTRSGKGRAVFTGAVEDDVGAEDPTLFPDGGGKAGLGVRRPLCRDRLKAACGRANTGNSPACGHEENAAAGCGWRKRQQGCTQSKVPAARRSNGDRSKAGLRVPLRRDRFPRRQPAAEHSCHRPAASSTSRR